jgi:hypothetical protein
MLKPGDRIWCPRLSHVIYVVTEIIGDNSVDYAVEMRREDGKAFRSDGLPRPQMTGVLVNAVWALDNGWELTSSKPPIPGFIVPE